MMVLVNRCHCTRWGAIVLVMLLGGSTALGGMPLPERWVYLSTNLLVDRNVEENIGLLERAAKAGYTAVVLTDSKFMRWDDLPDRYVGNVRRVRAACGRLKLKCIAAVCPMGYSSGLLAHDPNLAAGLPVRDAPFVARQGELAPVDGTPHVANGGFEESRKNIPTGWRFVDQPGTITFIDRQVVHRGKCALRLQDIGRHDPKHGHGRACQALEVQPFRYYHVSVAVQTRDFETPEAIAIQILGPGGIALNYSHPRIARTQDWRRVHVTFNSLACSKVNLYLGVWGGKGGTIWWDDLQIEPAGLVNIVRRAGAPIRVTSDNRQTSYVEGRDFSALRDPKMGVSRGPGQFTVWHDPPTITIPSGSRIHDGQIVRISYYHTALIHGDQVMCCMAEPKVYEILRWQVARVHQHLAPDGYFMQHDEIRVQGWDESCRRSGKTPGQLLAENIRRCVRIIRDEDPGKPIYVWSDMFDPTHNAKPSGRYYLVKGDGPWSGSWNGLDKQVTIVNWNSNPKKRSASLRHFSERGHRQILAGYYDGPIDAIRSWLHDAEQVPGVMGVMFTTWRHRYADLEAFIQAIEPLRQSP